jgi:hypothetical protein
MSSKELNVPDVRMVSDGSSHCFFGYYDKCPWDQSNRYLLSHRILGAQLPSGDSLATIGYCDAESGNEFIPLTTTDSWNWQQGSMLQWLENCSEKKILFNRTTPQGYGTVLFDIDRNEERLYGRPLAAASPQGDFIVSYNYGRLAVTHSAIGYFGHPVNYDLEPCPANDGLFFLDLETGKEALIFSYRDASIFSPVDSMSRATHWFSHAAVNPNGDRVLFLHRWSECVADENQWFHRLVTINPDGSDVKVLQSSAYPLLDGHTNDVWTYEYEKNVNQISHPVWLDDNHILAWSTRNHRSRYHRYSDKSADVEEIGGHILRENGHFTCSPNKKWLLTDTYPDPNDFKRGLLLFDMETEKMIRLGDFFADPSLTKDARCDLHPRWDREGKLICIDSVHEGVVRQLYTLDVSDFCKILL